MIALLLLLLSPVHAVAEDGDLVLATSCPTKEQIDPFVKMCGHNEAVALQARYCAEDLVAGWTEAASRLAPALGEVSRGARQSAAEESTRRSYDEASRVLYAEILKLQHYTAVVAEYPLVMVDRPGSSGDESSLGCFNDAFHHVEDVVKYLDGEIVRAKKVYSSVLALSETAGGRGGSLASVGSKGARRVAAVTSGKSPRSASTITGEIRTALAGSGAATVELNRKVPLAGAPFGAGGREGYEIAGSADAESESGLYSLTRKLGNLKGAEARPAGAAESVGSLLWHKGEGPGLELDTAGAKAQGSSPASAEGGGAGGEREVSRGSRAVASSEKDLFQLVTRRYRATELFRKGGRR